MIFKVTIYSNKSNYSVKLQALKIKWNDDFEILDYLTFNTINLKKDFTSKINKFVGKNLDERNFEVGYKYNYKLVLDINKYINEGICSSGQNNLFYSLDYGIEPVSNK